MKVVVTGQKGFIGSTLQQALKVLQVLNQPDADERQKKTNPWTFRSRWPRVKDGMSEAQVVALLGEPTSVKNTGPFRTLFYRGEVPGSGFVSGNVELSDDRVWQVNPPVF